MESKCSNSETREADVNHILDNFGVEYKLSFQDIFRIKSIINSLRGCGSIGSN